MSKKLVFDTLSYAKMLERGGVEHADVHSQSLAESIAQNMYTKDEVDKMIEASLKHVNESLRNFDDHIREMNKQSHDSMRSLENRTHEMDIRLTQAVHDSSSRVTRNIAIMVTLLALVASILHYIF